MRFVRPGRIEFPQPALIVFGPVVEIALRGSGKGFSPQLLAQDEKLIFQRLGQVGLRQIPHIRHDEHPVQKTGHQRRMLGTQQPPGRVVMAKQL